MRFEPVHQCRQEDFFFIFIQVFRNIFKICNHTHSNYLKYSWPPTPAFQATGVVFLSPLERLKFSGPLVYKSCAPTGFEPATPCTCRHVLCPTELRGLTKPTKSLLFNNNKTF